MHTSQGVSDTYEIQEARAVGFARGREGGCTPLKVSLTPMKFRKLEQSKCP